MDPELMKKLPHRNQGGRLSVGEAEDGNVSDMIPLTGVGMFVVTRKSIQKILLADNVDPQRNNPNIPQSLQERVLGYGSDHQIVGRTLLQAKELFLKGHLPEVIDGKKCVLVVLSFLKELASMQESIDKLKDEYTQIKNNFRGVPSEDGSLRVPVLKNLDRRMKEFIQNVDHLGGHIIDLIKLFPIQIQAKNPLEKIIQFASQKFGEKQEVVLFLLEMKEYMKLLRDLRNDMEHPDESGIVYFENYRMVETAEIVPPKMKHTRDLSTFKSIEISKFVEESNSNMINLFEIVMVLLCDMHTQEFAGEKVSIVSIPESERTEANPHMNYRYSIHWTK